MKRVDAVSSRMQASDNQCFQPTPRSGRSLWQEARSNRHTPYPATFHNHLRKDPHKNMWFTKLFSWDIGVAFILETLLQNPINRIFKSLEFWQMGASDFPPVLSIHRNPAIQLVKEVAGEGAWWIRG